MKQLYLMLQQTSSSVGMIARGPSNTGYRELEADLQLFNPRARILAVVFPLFHL